MPTEFGLRPLEPDDVQAVVEVSLAAWQPVYAHRRQMMGDDLYDAVHPDWREEKARQVREGCAADGGAILAVAEVAEGAAGQTRVIGFVSCYVRENGIGEIGNNAIHPDWQGRGIAPRLYEYAFDQLRARGVQCVRVRTGGDPAHAPARRAYQKVGFAVGLPLVEYYRAL